MPIASGAGHWPKEHLVQPAIDQVVRPSGPAYTQSYMPQWVPPNKVVPPKPYYVTRGSPSPFPSSPRQNGPNAENPEYDTPPPGYSSPNPKDGGLEGPNGPRNGNWGRNPNQQQLKPPRFFRGSEKYGHGHHRFGQEGTRPGTRPEFGHNKYGVRYDTSRQIISTRGTRPVGPKGLESYETYGPRMNMTTGACGPQMRPLWAMLGGLLALGALAGVLTGIALGVKSTLSPKKLAYVNPVASIRYYQQNGALEPCFDRFAPTTTTTTKTTTTTTTTTPKPTTTKTTPMITQCIPLTIHPDEGPITPGPTLAPNVTARPTTVCVWTTTALRTTAAPTTTVATTTVPTTTPPLTTQTTLPFCDSLTTSYTLITLIPIQLPSSAPRKCPVEVGLFFLLLAFVKVIRVG